MTKVGAEDALSVRRKITIVGGGYIGIEFAGIFQRFGSEVHVVCRQEKPLRGFDEEVRGNRRMSCFSDAYSFFLVYICISQEKYAMHLKHKSTE